MFFSLLYVLISGIALPVGGIQMQYLWRNQLGDVYSLGLGSAACLGVAKIALFDSGEQEFLANMFSNIRWNAVILALILWFFMNPGMFGKIGKNKVLKKIGGLHPIVFLAVAAAFLPLRF